MSNIGAYRFPPVKRPSFPQKFNAISHYNRQYYANNELRGWTVLASIGTIALPYCGFTAVFRSLNTDANIEKKIALENSFQSYVQSDSITMPAITDPMHPCIAEAFDNLLHSSGNEPPAITIRINEIGKNMTGSQSRVLIGDTFTNWKTVNHSIVDCADSLKARLEQETNPAITGVLAVAAVFGAAMLAVGVRNVLHKVNKDYAALKL